MFNTRRWIYWIAAVLALAFGAPLLFAQSGKPLNPKVAALIPEKPSNYLTDLAGVVKNPDEVNRHLSHLRDSLKLSLVAVTLPTISDLAVEEVALDIGRRWQVATVNDTIGAAVRNTGGVILLVMDSRKCRIEVATGSEGYMTDARAGDLCRAARTQFRAGDFGGGIIEISSGFAIFHMAELEAAQSVRPSSSTESDTSFGIIFFLVLLALVLIGIILYVRSERIRREEEERRSEELRQFNEKQRKIREQREKEAAIRREEERREQERVWNAMTPEQREAELALRRKRELEEAERRAVEAEKRRKRELEEAERRRIQRERDDEEDRRRRSSYDSIIIADFGSSSSSSDNSSSSYDSGGSDSFSGGGGGSDW